MSDVDRARRARRSRASRSGTTPTSSRRRSRDVAVRGDLDVVARGRAGSRSASPAVAVRSQRQIFGVIRRPTAGSGCASIRSIVALSSGGRYDCSIRARTSGGVGRGSATSWSVGTNSSKRAARGPVRSPSSSCAAATGWAARSMAAPWRSSMASRIAAPSALLRATARGRGRRGARSGPRASLVGPGAQGPSRNPRSGTGTALRGTGSSGPLPAVMIAMLANSRRDSLGIAADLCTFLMCSVQQVAGDQLEPEVAEALLQVVGERCTDAERIELVEPADRDRDEVLEQERVRRVRDPDVRER